MFMFDIISNTGDLLKNVAIIGKIRNIGRYGTILAKSVTQIIRIPNFSKYSYMGALRKCRPKKIVHIVSTTYDKIIKIPNIGWYLYMGLVRRRGPS